MNRAEPEMIELGQFLAAFNEESDRGAALVAAAMLDERLEQVLRAFFLKTRASEDLLSGFSAPLGTFAARAAAAHALGLIQSNEFEEITIIRKIRNEFGHEWQPVPFESGRVADLCKRLPWLGPAEHEKSANCRARFNMAVAILLTDLMWRVRLVAKERREERRWANKARA